MNKVNLVANWKMKRFKSPASRGENVEDFKLTPRIHPPMREEIMTVWTMRLWKILKVFPLAAMMVLLSPNSRWVVHPKRIRNAREETRHPMRAANVLSKAQPLTMVVRKIREKLRRMSFRFRVSLFVLFKACFMCLTSFLIVTQIALKVNGINER